MPLEVQVRNFQSIRSAKILIDGFTVITGTNNAGKTALCRAIRGVFQNSAPAALVRHGEAFLSVSLTWSDGTHLKWEKGWERADRKGSTVNRYEINGVAIGTVGRGPPPEVASVGVYEIPTGSEKAWPQIADQFDGTLFLVNRPGSALAEALSDVERVGKLSNALRASEKDRRAQASLLEVRREDLAAAEVQVSFYRDLDSVQGHLSMASEARARCQAGEASLGTVRALALHLTEARARTLPWAGFKAPELNLPDFEAKTRQLQELRGLRERWSKAVEARARLSTLPSLSLPEPSLAQDLANLLRLQGLAQELARVRAVVARTRQLPSTPLLDDARLVRLSRGVATLQSLKTAWLRALEATDLASTRSSEAAQNLQDHRSKVQELLLAGGVCPTCESPLLQPKS